MAPRRPDFVEYDVERIMRQLQPRIDAYVEAAGKLRSFEERHNLAPVPLAQDPSDDDRLIDAILKAQNVPAKPAWPLEWRGFSDFEQSKAKKHLEGSLVAEQEKLYNAAVKLRPLGYREKAKAFVNTPEGKEATRRYMAQDKEDIAAGRKERDERHDFKNAVKNFQLKGRIDVQPTPEEEFKEYQEKYAEHLSAGVENSLHSRITAIQQRAEKDALSMFSLAEPAAYNTYRSEYKAVHEGGKAHEAKVRQREHGGKEKKDSFHNDPYAEYDRCRLVAAQYQLDCALDAVAKKTRLNPEDTVLFKRRVVSAMHRQMESAESVVIPDGVLRPPASAPAKAAPAADPGDHSLRPLPTPMVGAKGEHALKV